MTHHTRPTHLLLKLNLAALALLHVCVFAPRPRAWQTASRNPVLPAPAPPEMPAPVQPSAPFPFGVPYSGKVVKKEWLLYALRSRRHDEAALVRLVERYGTRFLPAAEDEKALREAGATDRLLEAVRTHYRQPFTGGGMGGGGGMGAGERIGVGPGLGLPVGAGDGGGGNSEPVDYTRVFRQNEVTQRARITYKPDPNFTEQGRKNHVEGLVRLRAVLNLSGEVTNITTVKGLPDGLTEKAIDAARRISFIPAQKDGRAVSQHVILEYSFLLPLKEGDVEERAIILEKPEAEYTEEARRNGVRGKVVLKATLTHLGSVTVHSLEAGLPHGLNEKAAEAARRIVFEPARLGGRPVSQSVTLEYLFTP